MSIGEKRNLPSKINCRKEVGTRYVPRTVSSGTYEVLPVLSTGTYTQGVLRMYHIDQKSTAYIYRDRLPLRSNFHYYFLKCSSVAESRCLRSHPAGADSGHIKEPII